MRFSEFLARIDPYCDRQVLQGDVQHTFALLRAHRHPHAAYQKLLRMLMDWCTITQPDADVERASLVNALGPIRLEHQTDNAPTEGYAELMKLIRAIDAAFDDALLDRPNRSLQ